MRACLISKRNPSVNSPDDSLSQSGQGTDSRPDSRLMPVWQTLGKHPATVKLRDQPYDVEAQAEVGFAGRVIPLLVH